MPHRVPTSPTAATLRAEELYQQALNTIAAASGFHYVAIFPGTETIVGDAGRALGRQVVTFKSTYGLEAFELLIVSNGTLYFQGNAAAVEDQLGVTARHDCERREQMGMAVACRWSVFRTRSGDDRCRSRRFRADDPDLNSHSQG